MAEIQHGRRVAGVCCHCDEIFTRRVVDLYRTAKPFCSKRCHSTSMRTGRRKAEVPCAGCGITFEKLPSEVKRSRRHFCKPACYLANVDRSALGRAGAKVPREVPRLARFLRSQKAGIARGRNLSKEQLRAIAMKGVAARLAKKATRGPYRRLDRREINLGLEWFGPLLTRQDAALPARGCEGRTKRRVANPDGVRHEEEANVEAE